MREHALPIFVVGSGRNGTRSIFRMLRGNALIEAHHEYNCELIQRTACLYTMGFLNNQDARKKVYDHYHSALTYSQKPLWLDSSNKASWIIPVLADLFPDSKFIHIVRDPRRVVPSYYYKLREEMYDDASVEAMTNWIDSGAQMHLMPPLEKKYWWNLELSPTQRVSERERRRTRFERVCNHWASITNTIHNSFADLSRSRHSTFKLEELVSSKDVLAELLSFLGLDPANSFFSEFLQRPRNVFLPLEFNCTINQLETLRSLCSTSALQFEYDLDSPIPNVHY